MKDIAFIFLILFAVSMLIIYVAVRRRWLSLSIAGGGGAVVNSLCFILYCIAREMSFAQAIVLGAFFGCLFTVMTLIAATYFNAQERARLAQPQPTEPQPQPDSLL
ncbi:MAG: hypothetical protein KF716_04385 [Anaerolineae bacterium]|nr:hypothetical protein [Anaerolineae bacterium]